MKQLFLSIIAAIAFAMTLSGCGSTYGTYAMSDPNHISGEELVRTGQTSILGALQGLVPGLNIRGNEFTGFQSNIRGVNSIMLPSTPLFVVDGTIVNSLEVVNIHDVDYIEVDKDGSMYGARGANGVIKVFTKRGQRSNGTTPSVEYSTGTTVR